VTPSCDAHEPSLLLVNDVQGRPPPEFGCGHVQQVRDLARRRELDPLEQDPQRGKHSVVTHGRHATDSMGAACQAQVLKRRHRIRALTAGTTCAVGRRRMSGCADPRDLKLFLDRARC
jgi:hypothetical protein